MHPLEPLGEQPLPPRLARVEWVEGVVPENSAAPFHPNAAGEQGMAGAVTARL
ncbi:hypothetical protein [Dactylosporangium fulvum]|uniref:Uncharacterized protein n=1 Tax=Dactylosporangium fulvum TaxID=53359 RepID=A0ABY5W9R4_9ACTN|nr:hypothetical protein [Dactylosporangium fulvum]UWP86307.1 hypothetical protein Dfulv_19535 [Dactylosporangium fulvum]